MSTEIKISKLQEPKDWTLWKLQTRVVLKSLDVFKVVDGSIKRPILKENATSDEITAYNKLFEEWEKKDVKAQSIILTSVGTQTSLHIVSCNTSCEMWLKLHSVFEQKSETGIHFLQQKFFSFEKEQDDDIANFISKLEEIVQQLADLGEKIPESMVVTKILMALPAEYNHFHSAWESTSDEKKNLTELRNRLMVEEKRMMSKTHGEAGAFLARNSGKSKAKAKGKVRKCYKCGSTSHLKKECPNLQSKENSEALCCEALIGVSDEHSWFLDSGATDHMSNRRELFYDYEEFTTSHPVKIGNGDILQGIGVGKINVEVYDGDKWVNKYLSEVLHVPALKMNLFSQGKCLDKGYKMVSNSSKCEFRDGKRIVAIGVRETALYKMLIKAKPHTSAAVAKSVKGEPLHVWHNRLAHQNVTHVKRFLKSNEINFVDDSNFQCEACIIGKQHRLPFRSHNQTTTLCGELFHADVCGPIQINSIGGARYFLLIKDDFSHMRFVYFLKTKSEVAANIKAFVEFVNNQTEYKVKAIRSDNGTEFTNNDLHTYLTNKGIKHELTVAYMPEQNGCIERENRTIMEATRTMLHAHNLDLKLWAEGVNTSVYVLNRTGTSSVQNKSPCELWYKQQLKFTHLREFGTTVYAHIPKQKRQKLDQKAEKCLFVGYSENTKGYRVYNTQNKRVSIVRDLTFCKKANDNSETVAKCSTVKNTTEEEQETIVRLTFESANGNNAKQQHVENLENENSDDASQSTSSECEDNNSAEAIDSDVFYDTNDNRNFCDLTVSNILQERLRTKSSSEANIVSSCAFLASSAEPCNYDQAIKSDENNEWLKAMQDEYDSLIKNQTWILVDAPKDQKIVDNRWVYRVKRNPDSTVNRYKARLVARGFSQSYGVDYTETFSPVVKFASIRTLLAIAAERKMYMKQFDVQTAFLYGDLAETVYMKQPVGFNDGTNRVCKLLKSLYGLKQAPRCWNTKFKKFIFDFEFKESVADSCVFIRKNGAETTFLAIFVDDGLIISSSENYIYPVVEHLGQHFNIKVFDAQYFLGLEMNREADGSIHLSQKAYTLKLLSSFGFSDANAVSTPADYQQILEVEGERDEVNFPYRQAVGSLIYLAIGTRPDISFAVSYVSRFMEHPSKSHVTALKRIFRYLKGTCDYGILFSSKNANNFKFYIYSDADYAGCVQTRRSTTGYCLMLGTGIVSWCSERQSSVSHSTAESEYIAASQASRELVWLKRLLAEVDEQLGSGQPILYVDNESAVKLIKNPVLHKRTKHIEVRYHFVREKYEEKVFDVKGVSTENQLADIFTKALPKVKFENLRFMLNVIKNE